MNSFEIIQKNDGFVFRSNIDGITPSHFSISRKAYGGIAKVRVTLFNEYSETSIDISASSFELLLEKANSYAKKAIDQEIHRKGEEYAIQQTNLEQAKLEGISNALKEFIRKTQPINIEDLKKEIHFDKRKPTKPSAPEYLSVPIKPKADDYIVKNPLLRFLFPFLTKRNEKRKKIDIIQWEYDSTKVEKENESKKIHYEAAISNWNDELKEWEAQKEAYTQEIKANNELLHSLSSLNADSNEELTAIYFETILKASLLKSLLRCSRYQSRKLLIECNLPCIDTIPEASSYKWVKSTQSLKPKAISHKERKELLDRFNCSAAIYWLYICSLHDHVDKVDRIVVNGYIEKESSCNQSNEDVCILSIQAGKNTLSSINLVNADPIRLFKELNGLYMVQDSCFPEPIEPFLRLDKNDNRFIEAKNVIASMDSSVNLAAMDWQDFEHLVRDLFEKELSSPNSEVRITQSSRDKGVDAIAFDTDAIRGGKIIIQAKRYTNVVGVNHVRDLYGTIINEGAGKGILITTSSFGSEAYEFAKNKPITLINGQELLFLLKKHGVRVKIDLEEAKRINRMNNPTTHEE